MWHPYREYPEKIRPYVLLGGKVLYRKSYMGLSGVMNWKPNSFRNPPQFA